MANYQSAVSSCFHASSFLVIVLFAGLSLRHPEALLGTVVACRLSSVACCTLSRLVGTGGSETHLLDMTDLQLSVHCN